ncbi:MAG: VWA domain-containing protein [Phycisphaerales bacterium]
MRPLAAATLLALIAGTITAQITQTTTTTTVTTTTQPGISADHIFITPQARRPVWHTSAAVRLDAVNIDLAINDQVAGTTLELTLFNPNSTPQQAEILIPVPEGASVRSLQYDGTGPEPTAKVLPRDEARRIYDSIVGSMRDPALLEFARYGVLRTSAFPIPANTSQKIRITLEQVMTADSGRLDWILPRTEMLSGTGGTTPWTLKATVKSKDTIANVFSSSHNLRIERKSPTEFAVSGDASTFRSSGSLRLSVMKANANPSEPVFSTAAYPDASLPGPGGGYFNLIVSLPSPTAADQKAVKREVVLVIDRSGSMRGEKIKQAQEAARNVLNGLNDGELFNIIDFSDSINGFSPTAVVKDADSLKRALAYIDGIQANGGTNIRDSLVEAVHSTPATGTLPLVLFLTDGCPTVGERTESGIRAAVAQANSANRRLFTFGVGFDVNSPLLNALARSARGSATFVTPDENIEVKVSQMFKRLTGPVLASPKITIIDSATGQPTTTIARDLMPAAGEAPDVFDGEQFVVSGRYTAGQKFKVRIEGDFLGKAHTFEYEIDPSQASAQNSWVSRMWASQRIGKLLETLRTDYADKQIDPRSDPKAKELLDEVVTLSTRFGILTEYTAFLATEPTVALSDASAIRTRMNEELTTLNGARSGGAAVKQDGKLAELTAAPASATSRPGFAGGGRDKDSDGAGAANSAGNNVQYFYDLTTDGRGLQKRELTNVNQVQDRTFFNRNSRWVDGNSITKETEKPDRTVTVGSDDYTKLADELIAANFGGILALEGEVLLNWKGQNILLQNSVPQTEQPKPQNP